MAGIFDFTGQDIENTYQRVLQTDGNAIYDGTGSSFVVPVSSIDTSSLATTGSNIFTGNQTVIGNVNVTGSVNVSGSITASLFGTASHAIFADTASFAPAYLPLTGGTINGNVTVNGTASVSVLHVTYESASVIYSSGSNQFGDASNDVQTLYGTVDIKNGPVLVTGSLNVSAGITGSLFGTASYAQTSSYYNETDPVFVAKSASLATTGSNIFKGNQIVTGSLFTTGSNTLIGTTTLTGSLNITGSTIQVGNTTLLGNTTLSGSIIISGSTTNPPTVQVYGNITHDGYVRFNPVSTNIDTSISASYIYVSGSTKDLYFSQNSAGYSNVTRLRWLEGNLYTGLLHGGVITTQSATMYQISSGSGIIVNLNASLADDPYPTIQFLQWPNLSASIAPFTSSYQQCFVGIDSTNNIFAQEDPFTNSQFNTIINIGNVLFQNQTSINGVKTQPSTAYGFQQSQNIFNRAFGPLKLSGFTLSPSGSSTGSLVVGSGTSYAPGADYVNDPNEPYYVHDTGTDISKIFRYRQSGSTWVYDTNGGAGYATIDPSRYSNNGVLTAVPAPANRNWTIQRVFYFPSSVTKAIVVYYGNAYYGSESEALANIPFESFVEAPNTAANAIYLGAIIINGTGVFTNAATYTIYPSGLFRQVGGSGGGGSVVTQTLSGLSDVNVSTPTNGQALIYNSTALKWQNSSFFSGSVSGNADTSTSASYALTASFVQTAQTASYVLNAVSASYAPVFPYTGSAIVSGSLEITGSFSVLDAGGSTAINSSTYTLNDAANITSLNWDSKTLNDAFGNPSANWGDRTLYDSTGIDAINWNIVANGYVITQTGYKRDSISSDTQENFTEFSIGTAINTAGELINVETNIDLGVTKGDLVSLGEDGIWYQTDQSAISSSCMLGVATDVHPRGKILTEGTITAVTAAAIPDFPFVEGTSFSGKPVYMRPGVLGGFTTTTPTTGYVRVVGHLYYNSTTNSDYWLMKFRPSNDWYEI